MFACILAGGLGTRLRPLTDSIPKPMVPVAGRPFLQHQMERLAEFGVTDFVLAVGYRHAQIVDYFGDGEAFGWSIAVSTEDTPLGTGGAVARALPLLPERFLLLNGDTYLDLDWRAFFADPWEDEGFDGCIAVRAVEDTARYGRVEHDGRRVTGFGGGRDVSAGLYWLHRRALVGRTGAFSLEHDVLPTLSLAAHPIAGDFVDIGTFDSLARFRAAMEAVKR